MAVLFNCITGGVLAAAVGFAPLYGALALNAVGSLSHVMPANVMPVNVYTEVWTGEVVKQFSHAEQGSFMDGVPDFSRYAENDIIHLAEAGVDPDVLINNTTYPIPIQETTDGDLPISLDKYQTKVSSVTDDELYACSFDKISLRKESHGNAIAEKKFDKGIHAFGPASNTAKTPVIFATGELVDGRRILLKKDIIALKKAFDKAKVPVSNRRLVLCPDHIADILNQDQVFQSQYYDYSSGRIARMFGFDIYEYVNNPIYTVTGTKKSFGAVAEEGEYQASIAFHAPTMFKAAGSTKMYFSEAKTDPQNQRNLISFRHMFIALPKTQKAIGAIVSKNS